MTAPTRPGWRRTYARISAADSDHLDELANYWGASRAAIMRRALTAYLDAWREAQNESHQIPSRGGMRTGSSTPVQENVPPEPRSSDWPGQRKTRQ